MSGYQYRVIVTNPGFVCVVNDTSAVTTLVTRNDFDGDGIEDESDVDDDNDGVSNITFSLSNTTHYVKTF